MNTSFPANTWNQARSSRQAPGFVGPPDRPRVSVCTGSYSIRIAAPALRFSNPASWTNRAEAVSKPRVGRSIRSDPAWSRCSKLPSILSPGTDLSRLSPAVDSEGKETDLAPGLLEEEHLFAPSLAPDERFHISGAVISENVRGLRTVNPPS